MSDELIRVGLRLVNGRCLPTEDRYAAGYVWADQDGRVHEPGPAGWQPAARPAVRPDQVLRWWRAQAEQQAEQAAARHRATHGRPARRAQEQQ